MKTAHTVAAVCAAVIFGLAYLGLSGDPLVTSKPEAVSAEQTGATRRAAEPSLETVAAAPPAAVSPTAHSPSVSAPSRFKSLRQCFKAYQDLAAAKSTGDCKVYEGRQEFERAYAECLNGWKDWNNRAAAAEKILAGCGDVTDIDKHYFHATRAAAAAGDPDAQMCFLQFDFNLKRDTSPIGDADIAEYLLVAPTYVDAALKRGDWRVVSLLTRTAGPITRLDQAGEPGTIYRMTKLLRYGASGKFATGLDYMLKLLAQPDLKPEAALPSTVTREGDAWAEETYNTYFSGVPGITELPAICAGP